jgi:hypothetical protein
MVRCIIIFYYGKLLIISLDAINNDDSHNLSTDFCDSSMDDEPSNQNGNVIIF